MTALVTRLAARVMGGNAVYGDLPVGATFRFPGTPTIYLKGTGGWYTRLTRVVYKQPKFRTGTGTAVVAL